MYFCTYAYFALENALTKIGALFMVIGLTFGQEKKGFGQVRLFRNQRYYPCFCLHQGNLAVIFCFLLHSYRSFKSKLKCVNQNN